VQRELTSLGASEVAARSGDEERIDDARVGDAGALEHADLEAVDAAIRLVPLQVLVAVLERGDREDDEKRQRSERRRDVREAREATRSAMRVCVAATHNCRMTRTRKKTFATRRNCSSKFCSAQRDVQ